MIDENNNEVISASESNSDVLSSENTEEVISVIEKWQPTKDWSAAVLEIMPMILLLASLYVVSIIAITTQKILMVYITQGFLCKMRRKMFDGMQNLPIRYFDTHKHGDIMSHYTNDIDTLRQLISQAIPSLLRAGTVVVCVFCYMLYLSLRQMQHQQKKDSF